MLPGGIAMFVLAPVAGRMGERVGSKTPLVIGCAVSAAALTGLGLAHGSQGLVVLWSCLLSAGVGFAFAAMPNLIVEAVGEHETGEATGVNTIMRNIGASLGSQVGASIIAAHAGAGGLPSNEGFTLAFLVGAGGAAVAGLCALAIPRRRTPVALPARLDPVDAALEGRR